MKPVFKRASRTQSRFRMALIGPSGSGKTYSALLIARGIVGANGSIAVIDTESGSASLYDTLTEYDTLELQPPFEPRAYLDAIHAAEDAGYDCIIIDSITHAWAGSGGLLDMQSSAAKKYKNNSYAAWRDITPLHNQLVDAIIRSRSHVLLTIRTKTAYEIQEVDGKKAPIKMGLAPIFRDGLEYEMTTCLDLLLDGHTAYSTKDRTGLFDNRTFVPSVNTGTEIGAWLSGAKPRPEPEPEQEEKPNSGPPLTALYIQALERGLPVEKWKQLLANNNVTRNPQTQTPEAMSIIADEINAYRGG